MQIFRKNSQAKFDGGACRELIFELDKASKTTEAAVGCNNLTATVANLKSNVPIGSIVAVHRSIPEHVDEVAKPKIVDCGCQTDDDIQSKKISQASGTGRRITPNSSACPKKPVSNFSIRSAPERNTPIPLTLPIRRLTSCVSPRRSVPGRNIAAPVFVPKTTAASSMPETKDNEPAAKLLISRSQSDSVFETSSTLSESKSMGKPYASVECVNGDAGDDICPKSRVIESMRVINEGEVVSSKKVVTANQESLGTRCSVTSRQQSLPKNEQPLSEPKPDDGSVNQVAPVQRIMEKLSDAKPAQKADNRKLESTRISTSPALPNLPSPKSSETLLKQPTTVSLVVTLATSPPSGVTENAVPKTIAPPNKVTSDDKKSSQSPVDVTKKTDATKVTPACSNFKSRPPARPLDPKLQQRPNVAERKTNTVVRGPPSRPVNHKYVKNVGVFKTTAAAVCVSINASAEKGDQRKFEQPSFGSSCNSRVVKGKYLHESWINREDIWFFVSQSYCFELLTLI